LLIGTDGQAALPPHKAAKAEDRPPIGAQFFVPNRYP
jgi:hypothetical protein